MKGCYNFKYFWGFLKFLFFCLFCFSLGGGGGGGGAGGGGTVDAGPEPTYEEKMRVPSPPPLPPGTVACQPLNCAVSWEVVTLP